MLLTLTKKYNLRNLNLNSKLMKDFKLKFYIIYIIFLISIELFNYSLYYSNFFFIYKIFCTFKYQITNFFSSYFFTSIGSFFNKRFKNYLKFSLMHITRVINYQWDFIYSKNFNNSLNNFLILSRKCILSFSSFLLLKIFKISLFNMFFTFSKLNYFIKFDTSKFNSTLNNKNNLVKLNCLNSKFKQFNKVCYKNFSSKKSKGVTELLKKNIVANFDKNVLKILKEKSLGSLYFHKNKSFYKTKKDLYLFRKYTAQKSKRLKKEISYSSKMENYQNRRFNYFKKIFKKSLNNTKPLNLTNNFFRFNTDSFSQTDSNLPVIYNDFLASLFLITKSTNFKYYLFFSNIKYLFKDTLSRNKYKTFLEKPQALVQSLTSLKANNKLLYLKKKEIFVMHLYDLLKHPSRYYSGELERKYNYIDEDNDDYEKPLNVICLEKIFKNFFKIDFDEFSDRASDYKFKKIKSRSNLKYKLFLEDKENSEILNYLLTHKPVEVEIVEEVETSVDLILPSFDNIVENSNNLDLNCKIQELNSEGLDANNILENSTQELSLNESIDNNLDCKTVKKEFIKRTVIEILEFKKPKRDSRGKLLEKITEYNNEAAYFKFVEPLKIFGHIVYEKEVLSDLNNAELYAVYNKVWSFFSVSYCTLSLLVLNTVKINNNKNITVDYKKLILNRRLLKIMSKFDLKNIPNLNLNVHLSLNRKLNKFLKFSFKPSLIKYYNSLNKQNPSLYDYRYAIFLRLMELRNENYNNLIFKNYYNKDNTIRGFLFKNTTSFNKYFNRKYGHISKLAGRKLYNFKKSKAIKYFCSFKNLIRFRRKRLNPQYKLLLNKIFLKSYKRANFINTFFLKNNLMVFILRNVLLFKKVKNPMTSKPGSFKTLIKNQLSQKINPFKVESNTRWSTSQELLKFYSYKNRDIFNRYYYNFVKNIPTFVLPSTYNLFNTNLDLNPFLFHLYSSENPNLCYIPENLTIFHIFTNSFWILKFQEKNPVSLFRELLIFNKRIGKVEKNKFTPSLKKPLLANYKSKHNLLQTNPLLTFNECFEFEKIIFNYDLFKFIGKYDRLSLNKFFKSFNHLTINDFFFDINTRDSLKNKNLIDVVSKVLDSRAYDFGSSSSFSINPKVLKIQTLYEYLVIENFNNNYSYVKDTVKYNKFTFNKDWPVGYVLTKIFINFNKSSKFKSSKSRIINLSNKVIFVKNFFFKKEQLNFLKNFKRFVKFSKYIVKFQKKIKKIIKMPRTRIRSRKLSRILKLRRQKFNTLLSLGQKLTSTQNFSNKIIKKRSNLYILLKKERLFLNLTKSIKFNIRKYKSFDNIINKLKETLKFVEINTSLSKRRGLNNINLSLNALSQDIFDMNDSILNNPNLINIPVIDVIESKLLNFQVDPFFINFFKDTSKNIYFIKNIIKFEKYILSSEFKIKSYNFLKYVTDLILKDKFFFKKLNKNLKKSFFDLILLIILIELKKEIVPNLFGIDVINEFIILILSFDRSNSARLKKKFSVDFLSSIDFIYSHYFLVDFILFLITSPFLSAVISYFFKFSVLPKRLIFNFGNDYLVKDFLLTTWDSQFLILSKYLTNKKKLKKKKNNHLKGLVNKTKKTKTTVKNYSFLESFFKIINASFKVYYFSTYFVYSNIIFTPVVNSYFKTNKKTLFFNYFTETSYNFIINFNEFKLSKYFSFSLLMKNIIIFHKSLFLDFSSISNKIQDWSFSLIFLIKIGFLNFISKTSTFLNSLHFFVKKHRLNLYFKKFWNDRGFFFPVELPLFRFFFLYYSNFFFNFFETSTFLNFNSFYTKFKQIRSLSFDKVFYKDNVLSKKSSVQSPLKLKNNLFSNIKSSKDILLKKLLNVNYFKSYSENTDAKLIQFHENKVAEALNNIELFIEQKEALEDPLEIKKANIMLKSLWKNFKFICKIIKPSISIFDLRKGGKNRRLRVYQNISSNFVNTFTKFFNDKKFIIFQLNFIKYKFNNKINFKQSYVKFKFKRFQKIRKKLFRKFTKFFTRVKKFSRGRSLRFQKKKNSKTL